MISSSKYHRLILLLSIVEAALIFISIGSCIQSKEGKAEIANDSIKLNNVSDLLKDDDWKAPDSSTIPNDETGKEISYGKELIANTGKYFGPNGSINHFTNGMNCQNCHLNAGTKLYANNFSAVYSVYPKVRARSGKLEHIEMRINDCFERSLNGHKLDSLSKEMRAMIAYINWVGNNVKKGETPKGASVVEMKELDRAADPEKGKIVFQQNCISCHGEDGAGKLDSVNGTYQYPPLWGMHSFNISAGMYRLSRMAGFVKSNMPNLKSSYEKPFLTDEESWDVAAYIESRPRPEKIFPHDWPDISKKPFDLPKGPYADSYSEEQHKFGPYQPIINEAQKKNKNK
jgi:thiosulfate dehydrogenase